MWGSPAWLFLLCRSSILNWGDIKRCQLQLCQTTFLIAGDLKCHNSGIPYRFHRFFPAWLPYSLQWKQHRFLSLTIMNGDTCKCIMMSQRLGLQTGVILFYHTFIHLLRISSRISLHFKHFTTWI